LGFELNRRRANTSREKMLVEHIERVTKTRMTVTWLDLQVARRCEGDRAKQ